MSSRAARHLLIALGLALAAATGQAQTTLYAVRRDSSQVYTIAPGGTFSGSPITTAFDPMGITVNAAGQPITASYQSSSVRNLSTGVTTNLTNGPAGIALDGGGNYLVASYNTNSWSRQTPSGGILQGPISSGGFASWGIAADGLGNVYVANAATNTVTKFNSGGSLVQTFGGFSSPRYIATDAANNLYVSNVGTNAVSRIAGGTNVSHGFITGLNVPSGVAVDPISGDVFVANVGSGQITRYNELTGAYLGVYAAGLPISGQDNYGIQGIAFAPVPEPAGVLAVAAGLIGLVRQRRAAIAAGPGS